MKKTFLIIQGLLLLSCQSTIENESAKSSTLTVDSFQFQITNDSIEISDFGELNDEDNELANTDFVIINSLDSLINLSKTINYDFIEFNKNTSDSISKKGIKIGAELIDFFYNSQELKEIYEYYLFESFPFGIQKGPNNFLKIFILNADWYHSIHLDCFILDSTYLITDMFRPVIAEGDIYYAYDIKGKFISDSVFEQLFISYNALNEENLLQIRDSSKILYTINGNGSINKLKLFSVVDTIPVN